MIKVSVITVCYNAEKTIERTVESVISQSYPNFEYVIVDGGSRDSLFVFRSVEQPKITRNIQA